MKPPVLLTQTCKPACAIATTLADAVLWDYEVTLEVDHATTVVLVINEAALSESSPRIQIEPVPPDAKEPRCVKFERLHVLHAQQARIDVEGVTFSGPLQPAIQTNARIIIGGSAASLDTHIAMFLQELIGDSPFATHELSLECYYSHPVAAPPTVPAVLPILLVTRQEVARSSMTTLAGQCADAIQEWRAMNQPPENQASLIFRITFWPAGATDTPPLLDLTNVTLYVSDLT